MELIGSNICHSKSQRESPPRPDLFMSVLRTDGEAGHGLIRKEDRASLFLVAWGVGDAPPGALGSDRLQEGQGVEGGPQDSPCGGKSSLCKFWSPSCPSLTS